MTNPYRAMCSELLQELCCYYRSWELKDGYYSDVMKRANALLDQHEPPELTDEELLRTYGKAKRDHCYEGDLDDWPKKAELAATVAGLRAAIAADRSRRPTPQPEPEGRSSDGGYEAGSMFAGHPMRTQPPADGEVTELVEWLLREADYQEIACKRAPCADRIRRTAELLQRQHPQPVPVSERLPGAGDCDERGQCWLSTTATDPGWVLDYPERCTNWTHWLSANDIPLLPQQ